MAKDHAPFQDKDRKLALVIGNWQYTEGPLRNPETDSSAIAESLATLGFKVLYKQNLDRSEFRQSVREFGNQLHNYDVGVFYYAGHGLQVDGVNFLIPVDAEIQAEDEVQDESIEAELVLRKMKSAGNFLNLVILDACRNNPFSRSFRASSSGLARMNAPTGTLVAYSTAPGSVAADGQGEHSPYTKHLLRNMQIPGIPIEKVFKQVRIGLSMETEGKQVSWESSSLMGDFYFSKPIESEKQLQGMLEINVQNINGDVFVDNSRISFSQNDKTTFVPLLAGWHTVAVKKEDLEIKSQKVFIRGGNVSYVNWIKKGSGSNYRQNVITKTPKKQYYLPPP